MKKVMIIYNAGERRWKLANKNQVVNPVVPFNLSSYSTTVGATGRISSPRGELGPGKLLCLYLLMLQFVSATSQVPSE